MGEARLLLFLFRFGLGGLGSVRLGHALLEFIHAPGGIDELLLAGIERMADVANTHQDDGLGRASLDHVAASAADFGVLIFRMDFSFHTKAKEDSSQPRADKGFFGKSARPSGGISEPSSRESLCNRKRDMLGFQEGLHSL